MNTEINGNWGAYIKRFQLPSRKCFIYPLKSALIIFSVQLVVSMVYFLPILPFAKFLILFFVLVDLTKFNHSLDGVELLLVLILTISLS